MKWLNTKVPRKLKKLLRKFHIPLFERILKSIDYEDMNVVERMTTGFYFAGMLDKSGVDTKDCEVQEPAVTVQDLRMLRPKLNAFILVKVRPSNEEDELMKQVMEDAEEEAHGVARRIPVMT